MLLYNTLKNWCVSFWHVWVSRVRTRSTTQYSKSVCVCRAPIVLMYRTTRESCLITTWAFYIHRFQSSNRSRHVVQCTLVTRINTYIISVYILFIERELISDSLLSFDKNSRFVPIVSIHAWTRRGRPTNWNWFHFRLKMIFMNSESNECFKQRRKTNCPTANPNVYKQQNYTRHEFP